ncbi:MAG: 3-oxoacyl-[acyl-carrier protein] reductase, partial [uncultured Blastococcus sp.]
ERGKYRHPRGHRDRRRPGHRRGHRPPAGPGRVRRRRPRPGRGAGQGHRRGHRVRGWEGAGRRRRRERLRAGGGRRRADRHRARRPDRAGEQRRRPARQHAVQDVGLRLGHRDERAPAGRLPHDPRGPEVHDRCQVGPHRQPVEHLGAGQPRPGQLLDGQGRSAGLHEDRRDRAGQVRRHRERHRPRLHRDRDDQGDGRADGHLVRRLHQGRRLADPGGPYRQARGHRAPGVLLRQRGRRLRVRPGRLRRRRSQDV